MLKKESLDFLIAPSVTDSARRHLDSDFSELVVIGKKFFLLSDTIVRKLTNFVSLNANKDY